MAKCKHCGRTGVALSKDKKYCNLCTEEVNMNDDSLKSDKLAGTENASPSDDLILYMNDFTESMEKKFDMLRTELKSDLKKIT